MEYDARLVKSISSISTFKSVYVKEPFIQGYRYYFEVKFLHGSNFKIGISKNKTALDSAFCDTVDGYGFYSAGYLRNGSKTSG